MIEDAETVCIHRCLKPSFQLYIALGLIIFSLWVLSFIIYGFYGFDLFIAALSGVTPLVIATPLASYLTRKAEYKKIQPNFWFLVDKEAEKRRYGPLRAKNRALKYGAKW